MGRWLSSCAVRRESIWARRIIQVFLHGIPQDLLISSQVIADGRLNVLVSSQFLNQAEVGSVIAQICAERMSEQVRGDTLFYSCKISHGFQKARNVATLKPGGCVAISNKESRVTVMASR